ncbi:MAG: nitroreductase family protein [Dysgonomonas sp.]
MKKIFLFPVLALTLLLAACTPNPSNDKTAKVSESVDKQKIVFDNILNRHSIRSYKPDQVPKATIDTLLQTAINAPSANNKQPWEIRVVQSAEILGKINAIKPKLFHDSPTVLVIAKDKNNPSSDLDCGILSQTIMLTAEAMDLGTCALGSLGRFLNTPEAKEVADALDIPTDYEIVLAISLGYKNETPEAKPRDAAKIKFIN